MNTASNDTGDTGSAAFSLKWESPQNPDNKSLRAEGEAISELSYAPQIDCSTLGVLTVTANVYDSSNTYLINGGPWDCPAHSGTITNVPVGDKRKIAVYGKDSSNRIIHRGQVTGVTITANQTTNAGQVTMSIVTLDTTLPTDGTLSATGSNQQVSLSWSGFSDLGGIDYYKLVYSTSSTPSSSCSSGTQIYLGSGTSYTHTGLTNGTTYYYRVCVTDNAGNISSGVIASGTPQSIISDTTAPSSPSVSINSGATSTTSTSVTLTLSASDNIGVTGYYASETSTTPSASASGWTSVTSTTSYSASVSFTLSSGSGTKTVYVWFKDAAGNVSARVNDSIQLTITGNISTIDSTESVGLYTAIALDSNNKVHISYYDSTNSALKYTTNTSGSWNTTTVDNSGYVGAYTSIDVDSNNKAYISYFDDSNDDLVYATNSSGLWQSFIVDNSVAMGWSSSIKLDSNNKIHIVYYDSTNTALRYAANSSGAWDYETIDNNGSVGSSPSIAVDSTGKTYVSYYDGTNYDLKYAESITPITLFSDDFENGLGNWTAASPWGLTTSTSHGGSNSVTDSPSGNYGTSINISLAMTNPLTISGNTDLQFWHKYTMAPYYWWSEAYVEISTDGGTSWTTLAQYSGSLATWSKVGVDLSSNTNQSVKIRFRLQTNDAWWGDDGWYIDDVTIVQKHSISTIDSTGTVGEYTSIALDSNNKVHISYYDSSNSALKYATNASGSWAASTIDSIGDVGKYTSIAIDSNNKVHISYYDDTNDDLKYATNASGSWVSYAVDSTGNVGAYTSIAVDSNNKVHISYYDDTNDDLKYATNQ